AVTPAHLSQTYDLLSPPSMGDTTVHYTSLTVGELHFLHWPDAIVVFMALARLPVGLALLRKSPWSLDRVFGALHSQGFSVVHTESDVERVAEAHEGCLLTGAD